jgi:dienelactone hydrolase
VVELSTGADLRLTGRSGLAAVVCVNGGQAAAVPGTWSASLEWLVGRLSARAPDVLFAEVRYRVKSWRRLEWCVEDARAAVGAVDADRTLLLGFSMGGAVAVLAADAPRVEALLGLAPWLPDRLDFATVRGKRLDVLHGALDRPLPGIPGVSPSSSRRGFERALGAGAEGRFTLIPGGLHGVAVRTPLGLVPLARASRWADLAGERIATWVRGPAEGGAE